MIRRRLTQEITRTDDAPQSDGLVARYLTLGFATVELHLHRFETRWNADRSVSDTAHEVDGFTWECLGCGDDGRHNGRLQEDRKYMPFDERRAHTDANEHAGQCRSMPRPGGAR